MVAIKCLFIHIRDLRYKDNETLNKCLQSYKENEIKRIFFLNKEQIKSVYSSNASVNFFRSVLNDLKNVEIISVNNLQGIIKFLEKFSKKHKDLETIAFHYDYTDYAIKRETLIKNFAETKNIKLINTHDQLLLLDFHLKKDKTAYSKFTPYYNTFPISKIKKVHFEIPKFINKDTINSYAKYRECPAKNATTHLSHYLKFGVISPRQAYSLFKDNELLSRQLIWRDFYYTYYYYNGLNENLNKINWENNSKFITAWKEGKTGFPIVDAGMRQLKKENYMHNRIRMIVANFLVKILLIDWKIGEKHFSKNLIDIDRIQNMAGWQSVSSTAKHSLPYFRIFNPWIQSKKYDPKAEYIKKYIPELKKVPSEKIHTWYSTENISDFKNINYPKPIVNYNIRKNLYLKRINDLK